MLLKVKGDKFVIVVVFLSAYTTTDSILKFGLSTSLGHLNNPNPTFKQNPNPNTI